MKIDLNGNWQTYAALSKPGWKALGTITVQEGPVERTGALMLSPFLSLYSVRHDKCRLLEPRAVLAACNGQGHPDLERVRAALDKRR